MTRRGLALARGGERRTAGAVYALLAAGTAAAAAVGYLGYVFYPRFDLPSVTGAGLLALAAAAGVASFFSPCSFPLLVSILTRPAGHGNLVLFALALSVGATAFLLLLGGLMALGAGTIFEGVTFTSTAGITIRIVIGSLLILLGLVQLNRLPVSFRRFEPATHGLLKRQAALRRERPVVGFALFGFVYLLAGFG
jgi:cytochrome c biogenesis protein CcdA